MKRRLLRMCLATVLCLAASTSPAFAGANLLANPSFEDGGGSYDGWFTFGNGPDISLAGGQDDIYRMGVAAAKIFGEFSNCPDFPQFDVGGFGQLFTPTVGKNYQLSGWSFVSNADPMTGADACNDNRLIAKIVFFDSASGGNEISGNEVFIGNFDSVVDQWNPFTVETVAPPGALRVEALFLFLQPACDEGAVFVDDVVFCQLPDPPATTNLLTNPSFDVDLSGWSIFGNVSHSTNPDVYRTPAGCARMFGSFDPGSDSGLFQSFAASAGRVWRLDVHTLNTCQDDPIAATSTNFVLARIVFRDALGEIGGNELIVLDASSPLGKWERSTVFAGAPAGTQTAECFILFVQPDLEGGAMFIDDVTFQEIDPVTDTPDVQGGLGFVLGQNVPNPFNPTTRIEFALAQSDVVDLSVYDISGRRIATLVSGELVSGAHSVVWNGTAGNGRPAASGIYRYVLETSSGRTSRSMMLVK